MKNKTLSLLCLALLSVTLVSGSAIKNGLSEIKKTQKNVLAETACPTCDACDTTPNEGGAGGQGTLPPPQGAGEFTINSAGATASIGQSHSTLPGGAEEDFINCASASNSATDTISAGGECAKRSYCFNGSVDYQKKRCVRENHCAHS